jgi:hypothetical protein
MAGKECRISLDKNAFYRSPDIYNCTLFKNSVIIDVVDSAFINKFTAYNVEYIIIRKSEERDTENIKIENKNL